jgi:hypothetical protein
MSWWSLPIEDDAPASKRKFSHKVFLDQVIDILNACVPLYNWKTGRDIDELGPYILNVTSAQAIWRSIQTRIEVLVGRDDEYSGPGAGEVIPGIPVFYDYATLDNASWFSAGSPTDPRAQPDYMHYNVFKRFKELARDVPDIPTLHLMRQEDVEATSISATVPPRDAITDLTVYNFAAGIVGFKWDSVSVDGFTQAYYENMADLKEPDPDHYAVIATGGDSEDGGIYFSRSNIDDAITINYNVDATRFGWTRRVNGETAPNVSSESFNSSTRTLSLVLSGSLAGAHELALSSMVNIWFTNSLNVDVAISSFTSDTSFSVTLPTGVDPGDHGGTSAVRNIYETGDNLWEDRAQDGDVIHACLLNQIYACTVVLQDYAVLVDASHSKVAGGTLADGSHSWETEWGPDDPPSDVYCATDDNPGQVPWETWQEACEKAKDEYLTDKGPVSANRTSCHATGGPYGTDGCVGWSGYRSKYALLLTDVPIGYGGVAVKDFAYVLAPGQAELYVTGVPVMVAPYMATGKYHKTADLTETGQENDEFTLATHGGGIPPLEVAAAISCTAGCDDGGGGAVCRTGDNYSADGWACVKQSSPDPSPP